MNKFHWFFLVCIIAYSVCILGDLVDARTYDMLGSRQYIEEWLMYQNILNETGVTNNTIWLDIRGNHGNCQHFCLMFLF